MLNIDHRVFVSGTGMFVPDEVVTNEILEAKIENFDHDMSEEGFGSWVDRVTHISERRILHRDYSSGDLARVACNRAIKASGVDPAEIGLFIMATFTPKNLYPGEETMLAKEFGMQGAATFYLTAACAGGIYGMHVANAFLKCGFCRHALVVGSEHLTTVIDWSDPLTAILFGDGAGAVVLSRRDEEGPGGVMDGCVLGSNYVPGNIMMDNNNVPKADQLFSTNGSGTRLDGIRREFLRMEGGPRVLRTAVNTLSKATVESLGFTMKDLKSGNEELRELLSRTQVVPHQANGRILDGLRDKLEISDEQLFKTIYRYGNISCASNLITLDYAVRRGNMRRSVDETGNVTIEDDVAPRIRAGDLVAVPTVGAGYLDGCFTYVHEDYAGE